MGSRATGLAKAFSDLDLEVMGDDPLDLLALGHLRDAFDESNLPFAVDIIERASASEAFRRVIDGQARPLRQATHGADRRTCRAEQNAGRPCRTRPRWATT